jgi:hypothetical protein
MCSLPCDASPGSAPARWRSGRTATRRVDTTAPPPLGKAPCCIGTCNVAAPPTAVACIATARTFEAARTHPPCVGCRFTRSRMEEGAGGREAVCQVRSRTTHMRPRPLSAPRSARPRCAVGSHACGCCCRTQQCAHALPGSSGTESRAPPPPPFPSLFAHRSHARRYRRHPHSQPLRSNKPTPSPPPPPAQPAPDCTHTALSPPAPATAAHGPIANVAHSAFGPPPPPPPARSCAHLPDPPPNRHAARQRRPFVPRARCAAPRRRRCPSSGAWWNGLGGGVVGCASRPRVAVVTVFRLELAVQRACVPAVRPAASHGPFATPCRSPCRHPRYPP